MPKKPSGLPSPVGSEEGLPPIHVEEENPVALDRLMSENKKCPKCGKAARVVSNRLGVNAHCGPCKTHWPLTNSPLKPESPSSIPRGFSKHTMVEPDWNMAFDDDVE